jgi:hypothetical protein
VDTNEQVRLYNQSLAYLEGDGVPVDVEKSFALNARAANAGYRPAVLPWAGFISGAAITQLTTRKRRNGIGRPHGTENLWHCSASGESHTQSGILQSHFGISAALRKLVTRVHSIGLASIIGMDRTSLRIRDRR